jgi:hypothetical protein
MPVDLYAVDRLVGGKSGFVADAMEVDRVASTDERLAQLQEEDFLPADARQA